MANAETRLYLRLTCRGRFGRNCKTFPNLDVVARFPNVRFLRKLVFAAVTTLKEKLARKRSHISLSCPCCSFHVFFINSVGFLAVPSTISRLLKSDRPSVESSVGVCMNATFCIASLLSISSLYCCLHALVASSALGER